MAVDIAHLQNGKLALITDEVQPCEIAKIAYFQDQHLFQVIYENSVYEELLVNHEFDKKAAHIIEQSPDVMLVVIAEKGVEPYGYSVPLVQYLQ